MRVAGFALVAVALVVAVLAFSRLERYNPARGLAWNLANAEVIVTMERVPCPPLTERQRTWAGVGNPPHSPNQPRDCGFTRVSTFPVEWVQSREFYTVPNHRVSLGVALTGLVAVGLVGVGMMVFAPSKEPAPQG